MKCLVRNVFWNPRKILIRDHSADLYDYEVKPYSVENNSMLAIGQYMIGQPELYIIY